MSGIKVESPYDLNVGDVIKLDQLYYQITEKDELIYPVTVGVGTGYGIQLTTQSGLPLTPPFSNQDVQLPSTLSPENNGLYYLYSMGIEGTLQAQWEYPFGNKRQTPHGASLPLDSKMAGKYDPWVIDAWILPNTPGGLSLTVPSGFVSGTIWFTGLRFRVSIITAAEKEALINQGANWYEGVSSY